MQACRKPKSDITKPIVSPFAVDNKRMRNSKLSLSKSHQYTTPQAKTIYPDILNNTLTLPSTSTGHKEAAKDTHKTHTKEEDKIYDTLPEAKIDLSSLIEHKTISITPKLFEKIMQNKQEYESIVQKTPAIHKLELPSYSAASTLFNSLKAQIDESNKAHTALQQAIDTTKSEIQGKEQSMSLTNAQLHTLISELQDKIKQKDSFITSLQKEFENYKANSLYNAASETLNKIATNANQSDLVRSMSEELETIRKEKEKICMQYTTETNNIKKERELYITRQTNDNSKVMDLESQLNEAKGIIQTLEKQKIQLEEENEIHDKNINEANQKITQLQNKLNSNERNDALLQQATNKTADIMQQYKKLSDQADANATQLKEQLDKANTNIATQAETIHNLEQSVSKLKAELIEYKSKLLVSEEETQKQKLIAFKNMEEANSLKDAAKKGEIFETINTSLKDDITKAITQYDTLNSDYETIKAQSDKLLHDNTAIIEKYNALQEENNRLTDMVLTASQESEIIKEKLITLKSNFEDTQKYMAVPDDQVDVKLAEEINKRIEIKKPIMVPFTRQSKGMYMFGTTKVLLKIELEMLIVRVGGGYKQFDEFLKIQVPLEIERIKQNEVLRTNSSKIMMIRQSLNSIEERISSPNEKLLHATKDRFSPKDKTIANN